MPQKRELKRFLETLRSVSLAKEMQLLHKNTILLSFGDHLSLFLDLRWTVTRHYGFKSPQTAIITSQDNIPLSNNIYEIDCFIFVFDIRISKF